MNRTEAIEFANMQIARSNDLADQGKEDLATASATLALLTLQLHHIRFCVEHWQIIEDGKSCAECKDETNPIEHTKTNE